LFIYWFFFNTMNLFVLFALYIVVAEKCSRRAIYKNSHLEVLMSEIVVKNCAIRAEKSNPQ
ncbi:hypothetical protein, partial [Salmonella enterica]|uniref:hypothetical protein n=1 Tax=Salmonella enterica TaxID=28901 RepID=UPI0038BB1EDB